MSISLNINGKKIKIHKFLWVYLVLWIAQIVFMKYFSNIVEACGVPTETEAG